MKLLLRFWITGLFITAILPISLAAQPLSYSNFKICISSSPGPTYSSYTTCTLRISDSPHTVNTSNVLYVGRNVIVEGEVSGSSYPKLVRDRSSGNGPQNLMIVQSGVTGATIRYLEFDGSYGTASSPPSTCNWSNDGPTPPNVDGCKHWADLQLDTGSQNVTISTSRFRNAAERAVQIQGAGHTAYALSVSDGRNCGINIANATNARIWSSTMSNNLGAGVCASSALVGTTKIGESGVGNTLLGNHFGAPDGHTGGQVYVGGDNPSSTKVLIQNNIVDGNNVVETGVEIDPNSGPVEVDGNSIYEHTLEGVNIKWNNTTAIKNGQIYSNAEGIRVLGGESLSNPTKCGTPCGEPTVTITGVSAYNNSFKDVRTWGVQGTQKIQNASSAMTFSIENYSTATCVYLITSTSTCVP